MAEAQGLSWHPLCFGERGIIQNSMWKAEMVEDDEWENDYGWVKNCTEIKVNGMKKKERGP